MKVSIIITARNYGAFLAECIESCLLQTVQCEVIYSDDCSTDNSLLVARKYPILVIAHDAHVGVAQARNDGAKAAAHAIYLFVDGDDVLTPDYVERHLEVYSDETPFVYGAYKCFGLRVRHFNPPHWGEKSLWNQNICNSSSLINGAYFWKVGGWKQTPNNTYWDWDLFLRMSRLGIPRKSNALLLYRKHGNSSVDNNPANSAETYVKNLRQFEVLVTVGLVYSGRLPELFSEWMDSLVNDVSILVNLPELIIINTNYAKCCLSGSEKFWYRFNNSITMKNIIFFAFLFCSTLVNAQHYQYDTTHVQMLPVAVTSDSIYLQANVHTIIVNAPQNKFIQVDRVNFVVSINANTLEVITEANEIGETYSANTYPNNPSDALQFQVAGTNPQYDIQTTSDSLFTSFQLITKIKNVPVGKFEQADNGKVGDIITVSFSDLLSQIPAAGVALKNKLYPDIP